MSSTENQYPKTVAEAIEILHASMSLNEEFTLAYMDEVDLFDLHLSLGHDIRDDFGLWAGNEALLESCRVMADKQDLHIDDASMVIIKALWKKVKKSNIMNSED
jgi:threonine synthase